MNQFVTIQLNSIRVYKFEIREKLADNLVVTSRGKSKFSSQTETRGKIIPLRRIDVDATHSDRKGISGLVESTFRTFKTIGHALLMLPLYVCSILILGFAVWPAAIWFNWSLDSTLGYSLIPRLMLLSFSGVAAFYIFGFSLLLILPIVNFLMRVKLAEWRGPYYSLSTIKWYIHNGLTYLARYTILEFVTPTPFSNLFYRGMGMKIGDGVNINSTAISDPSLIEIGNNSTIGGSATIVAHYGQGGYLVLAPVKIGSRVTVGLRAVIMGGTVIGDHAKILPNSVVLPKTVIGEGETWGGVPAQKLDLPQNSKSNVRQFPRKKN